MGFELDEWLYAGFLKLKKYRSEKNEKIINRRVVLEELKPKLTLMARAISGAAIDIYPADREGGYKNENFFLPIEMTLFETKELNAKFYVFRMLYLCVQRQLNLNWTVENYQEDKSTEKAKETSPQVLKQLFDEFPSLHDWYDELVLQLPSSKEKTIDTTWLYGKWMRNENTENTPDKLTEFDQQLNRLIRKEDVTTTLKVKAVEEMESLAIDQKQQEDYVLLHSFEKIETAEEFSGNWRDFDGKDDLEEHQNALEEMNMQFTVRVDDTVHSVYQADFVENTTVAESADIDDKGFYLKYDEWDFKKRQYLLDYCKVYPRTQLKTNPNYYQKTIDKNRVVLNNLRKMLTSVNNKMQIQRRQLQGENFDLDALTDLYVDVRSNVSPNERVYLSQRKKEKDLAILLLLDTSLSSDGYAAGNRVIDVEKEAAILFGEILNEFDIQFGIDSFSSKTRNYTTYLTLKEFGENWNRAKHKIGAVEPSGFTRIGPALRHAGARLDQVDASNKWVIVLSDGKPNDYDKYEGKHGIHDIKQALRELNERQINTYALAIEAQARYYLPQMFGQNHYQVLTSPTDLIQSLAKLYEKIKHV